MLFDIAYALQLARLIDFERLASDAAYRKSVIGNIARPGARKEPKVA